jgi:hypothetical protein
MSDKPHLLERPNVIDKLCDTPWKAPINTSKQVYQELSLYPSSRFLLPPTDYTGDITLEEYVERKKK